MKYFLPLILLLFSFADLAIGQSRFPKPEFESGYRFPVLTLPQNFHEYSLYLSLALMLVAMLFTAYFIFKSRSRTGVFVVMLISLLYFGFYRHGCICAVGSIQNVALAVFSTGSALPFGIVVLFLLPLFVALIWGRVFCGAVCPLGAIQDIVAVKPRQLPEWLEHCLGMIPYIYLGLAVLYAANGAGFIICRYDPFVSFFRLSGSFSMLLTGVLLLLLGVFVARPYCRFLCPYGVLLRWMAFFAKYRLSITPGDCVQCRLCEDSCPFGAIRKPLTDKVAEPRDLGRKRLAVLLALLPVLILFFAWGLGEMNYLLARAHPVVALARQVAAEDLQKSGAGTLESQTFYLSGKAKQKLYAEAHEIYRQFKFGCRLLGAFLGLALSLKLLGLAIRRVHHDYEPDRMKCLSCGRCFSYCPVEKNIPVKTVDGK